MTILVIGASGQVARALVRRATARGLPIEALGRPDIDLEQPESAARAIAERRPRVVINAAAYTAVDKAEDEPERAHRINADGPGRAAKAAADIGAPFIHFSTDYVFPGDKAGAYLESDPTGPKGAYGRSKLNGEELIRDANPRAVILRTAWVFDAAGANFVRTMLRLARTRDEVGVVADQHGCPTFADDLADAALAVAQRPETFGVYHCAGQGDTSWAGFAAEVFAQSRARGGPSASVRRISTADFPTRATRPANSRLDCAKLRADYGVEMRPWRQALGACLDEIAANGWRVD